MFLHLKRAELYVSSRKKDPVYNRVQLSLFCTASCYVIFFRWNGKITPRCLYCRTRYFWVVNYQQRMQYAQQLQKATVNSGKLDDGNSPQNIAVAKSIVEKVRKLYVIPADVEPTVAQIVDVNKLKEKNSFYNNAKTVTTLLSRPLRALLYDPSRNIILDVVPVQLQAPEAPVSSPIREISRKAPSSAVTPASSSVATDISVFEVMPPARF